MDINLAVARSTMIVNSQAQSERPTEAECHVTNPALCARGKTRQYSFNDENTPP